MELAGGIAGLISFGGKLATTTWLFALKIKDAPFLVKNLHVDLKSIISVLEKIKIAVLQPGASGIFSYQKAIDEFKVVLEGLKEVFLCMHRLLIKYDKINSSWMQKVSWATHGEEEAIRLATMLGMHKANLGLTLQVATGDFMSESFSRQGQQLQAITDQIKSLKRQLPDNEAGDARLSVWFESVATYAGSIRSSISSSVQWSYRNSSTSSLATVIRLSTADAQDNMANPVPSIDISSPSPDLFEATEPISNELTPPATPTTSKPSPLQQSVQPCQVSLLEVPIPTTPPTPKADFRHSVAQELQTPPPELPLPVIPVTHDPRGSSSTKMALRNLLPVVPFRPPRKETTRVLAGALLHEHRLHGGLMEYMTTLKAQAGRCQNDPDIYIWFLNRTLVAEGGLSHLDQQGFENKISSCPTCRFVDKAMRLDIGLGYEILVHLRKFYMPIIPPLIVGDLTRMYGEGTSDVLNVGLRASVRPSALTEDNFGLLCYLLEWLSGLAYSEIDEVRNKKKDGLVRQFKEIIGVPGWMVWRLIGDVEKRACPGRCT